MQVITFDFHNTLANCDPWFDLEVRSLPWAVLERLDPGIDPSNRAGIDQAYRQLRLDVIASGNEIDAYDSVTRILDQAGHGASRAGVIAEIDALMSSAIEHMVPVPGAASTVRQLHENGLRLGVVSSAVHHQTLQWILDRMGIAGCFEAVVSSASSGYYKSTPAIYEFALARLGGDLRSSVHVGDSLRWDIEVAQQAGLRTAWLRTGRREVFATETPGVQPSLVLDSMANAAPLLMALLDQAGSSIDA